MPPIDDTTNSGVSPENTAPNGTGAPTAEGTPTGDTQKPGATDTQTKPQDTAASPERSGEDGKSTPDLFAELDADTREWLEKRKLTDPKEIAKTAREQAKLLGTAIRMPGKDATEEEIADFLNKLGRPEDPKGYEFEVPPDLPEELPYDAERADEFKSEAHKLGLTKQQAEGLYNWYTKIAVGDFNGQIEGQSKALEQRALGETEKLVKRWGPLEGETARSNFELADRAIRDAGGEALVEEFKQLGLIGPNKEVLSETLAVTFANIGAALYREDGVLRGSPDAIGNPFAEGENFNITKQMQLVRQDKDRAMSLIAAAGKKPEDFGMKA